MAKLPIKSQKIFGLNAPTRLGVFGSLKANNPQVSSDLDLIQSTSFENGLAASLIAGKAPAIEDLNSLFYVPSYQLSYILQQGIPEHDANTMYHSNSIVQKNGSIWKSLVDDNLTDLSYTYGWVMLIPYEPLVKNPNFEIYTDLDPTDKNISANVMAKTGELIYKRDGKGSHRLLFNQLIDFMPGTSSVSKIGSPALLKIKYTGVKFKNVVNYKQAITAHRGSGTTTWKAQQAYASDDYIYIHPVDYVASSAYSGLYNLRMFGDVELEEKPSWA